MIALMGDGSFQYSLQAIYTGVQRKLRIVCVVFDNQEYGILKEFAELEQTPDVPGLDLPGIDIVALGRGYGAEAVRTETLEALSTAFRAALAFEGVTVLVVAITRKREAADRVARCAKERKPVVLWRVRPAQFRAATGAGGADGEREIVSQTFQPDGRSRASNSL